MPEQLTEYEIQILDYIRAQFSSAFGDLIMPYITCLGNAGILWIIVTLLLLIVPRTRRSGVAVAISLVSEAILCNLMIKPVVARERPFDLNMSVVLLIRKPLDYSFPSGHTGASFAVVGALLFQKSRLWIPALIPAVLIAFSRLYLYVHYPTDVLAGVALGMLTGFIGAWCSKKIYNQTNGGGL